MSAIFNGSKVKKSTYFRTRYFHCRFINASLETVFLGWLLYENQGICFSPIREAPYSWKWEIKRNSQGDTEKKGLVHEREYFVKLQEWHKEDKRPRSFNLELFILYFVCCYVREYIFPADIYVINWLFYSA